MKRIEIITYSRSTGDIRHSHKTYTTAGAAEKELKKAGFTQNPQPAGHLVQREVLRESKGDCTVIQKYIISLPPITKKNSQQILTNHRTGKPFIAPSRQYKKYEQAAMWYLTPKPKAPLSGRYRVATVFYMPTRRKVDLTNLLEACHDTLVAAKILADDNNAIIASVDGSRVMYDKENPRTEIFIEEMPNDEQPV